MGMTIHKINGIEIEVKSVLSVDDKTFRTCMSLIDIYGNNNDMTGMIIRFGRDGFEYIATPIYGDQEYEAAMYAKFNADTILKKEVNSDD